MTILRGYPSTMPSATLDFAASKKLDPRIAFSRASAASPDSSAMVDGKVQTFGIDVPRLSDQGLLIEEGSTNYIITSVKSIGTPIGTNVTVTNNATDVAAPDGTFTATRIQADSISYIPVGFSGGITFSGADLSKVPTFSYWIYPKSIVRSGQTAVGMYFENDGDQFTKDFKVVLNKWQRIFITWEGTFDQTKPFNLSVMRGCTDLAAYFWGFQCEPKNFPTSLIPTNGSTVTRAADVAEMPADYNVNQYTIINHDFGVAGGSDTLTIVGAGTTPAQRTAVYSDHLTQEEVNAVAGVKDEWWEWRVLGASFALPNAKTDGQVTIDWGDGSTETLSSGTTGIPEHVFANLGGYQAIRFRLDSGTYFRPSMQGDATQSPKIISVGTCPPSMKVNAYQVFKNCANLETLDAGFGPTSSTYDLRDAFNGCSSLLDFPWIDTAGIVNFSIGWQSCSSLTSFPPLDTSSATTLGYAWSGCTSLKTFPFLQTSNVGSLQSAWRTCSALTSFPAIDTSNVINFNSTWSSAQNLTSFPLIDTSSGQDFTNCWNNCRLLTSFPAIDTSQGDDFNSTWQNCVDLISFPLLDTSNGLDFTRAWNNCNSLLSFPLLDTSQGEQFDFAWANCSSLTSFPLIDTSSALDFYKTWQGCSGLLSFPLLNTSQVTRFSGSWALCSNLASFPQINASSGTDFSGAWSTCGSLTSFPAITFSASATTFKNAWLNCSSLQNFPSGFFDSWTGPPNAQCFYQTWKGCSDLTATSVEYILDSLASLGGPNAPAGSGNDVEIEIDYDTLAGVVPYGGSVDGGGIIRLPDGVTQPASILTLKSRNWTVIIDGTAQ